MDICPSINCTSNARVMDMSLWAEEAARNDDNLALIRMARSITTNSSVAA